MWVFDHVCRRRREDPIEVVDLVDRRLYGVFCCSSYDFVTDTSG